jgi:VanZ family protein
VTDEIHQYFVRGRNASVLDVMADGTVCLIGSLVYPKVWFGKAASRREFSKGSNYARK